MPQRTLLESAKHRRSQELQGIEGGSEAGSLFVITLGAANGVMISPAGGSGGVEML